MFKGYRVSREIEYLDQSQSEGQRERGRSGREEKKKKKLNFELRRESTSRGKWGCSKKANVGRCSQRRPKQAESGELDPDYRGRHGLPVP